MSRSGAEAAGDALREHLRRYPALGHCTTIDWFLPWPEEAAKERKGYVSSGPEEAGEGSNPFQ